MRDIGLQSRQGGLHVRGRVGDRKLIGVPPAFSSLPIAVASLVSCATDAPTAPLSEILIELMLESLRALRLAVMLAAVSAM